MPPPLQVDLQPIDLERGVRVFLGLSVLDLGPMYATDRRQTDRCPTASLLKALA